ncbi:MAG: hypothetical protein RIR70_731 [Pseudomonadota bacterium]|jgi:Leucine-rich repeat (LRR) protein
MRGTRRCSHQHVTSDPENLAPHRVPTPHPLEALSPKPLAATTPNRKTIVTLIRQLSSFAMHQAGSRTLPNAAGALSQALLDNVEAWRESSPAVEHSSRQEAQRRILRNQVTGEKRLELSHLTLSSLPAALGLMKHLEHLDVMNAGLRSVPAEIGNLYKLKCLHLAGNDLTELPDTLRNLQRLKRLFLNSNQFDHLPEWLGELPKLELLHVPHNNLKAFPESLQKLPALSDLDAHDNQFRLLPDWLNKIPSLRFLDMASNPIENLHEFAADAQLTAFVGGPPIPKNVAEALRLSRPSISSEASSPDEIALAG